MTYDMDVGCNLCSYNITRAQPFPQFPKIHHHLHNRNSVRVDPYAHPQLIKVLKHFAYK